MRIWIIASDPFLKDFERASTYWPPDTEVYLTTLSKYGVNVSSFLRFTYQYIKIRPDAILTDHGYLGFWFSNIVSKVMRINTKRVFFLRGNWWLEERLRNG